MKKKVSGGKRPRARKALLCFVIVFLTAVPMTAGAESRPRERVEPGYVTGEIIRVEGTTVVVKDEQGVDTYRFFAHSHLLEDLQAGDRVRVYYDRPGRTLTSIKKMTPVECGPGRNAGNISGCRGKSRELSAPYSALNIKINMKKREFAAGDPVTGTVVIHNTYPAALPAVFRIRLFHQGRLVEERTTSVATLLPGVTKIPFDKFGIPQFNNGPADEGRWRIVISQQGIDEECVQEIIVLPAQEPSHK